MQSQETQPIVLDSQQLPNLHADLAKEIYNNLNHANLVQLLEKYGLAELESFQLQFVIDLSQAKPNEVVDSAPNQGILPSITPPKIKLQCYYHNGQWYSCGYP